MEHNGIEYCFQCNEYPCEKYEKIDKFDSFISHRNQKSDLEKARQIGIEAYNAEQEEKVEILGTLLAGYNDGRKKTLFCVAVNLPVHIVTELEQFIPLVRRQIFQKNRIVHPYFLFCIL